MHFRLRSPRGLTPSLLLAIFTASTVACSSEDVESDPSSAGAAGGGGAGTGGSASGGTAGQPDDGADWSSLVEGDWSMPPGDEGYVCVRTTIEEDTYIRGFGAIAPVGTHHTLLTLEPDGGGEEGVFECTAATNGPNMLFGSGVGTEDIEFPEGVAIKLEAGSQVLLNLHLYNTSVDELTGRSGIRVLTTTEESVEHEAEIILAGKVAGLTVEPGSTWQTGSCAMTHDVTIFAVSAHMHQLGAYNVTTAEPEGGEPRVLIDEPYSFEEQIFYPVDPPLTMAAGDRVTIECQYENTGDETVYFGDSSDAEMCFSGLYRYPKGDSENFICTEGGSGAFSFDAPACVEEGASGNDLGVGRYCTEGGGECEDGLLCLADVASGAFANFCTRQCADDTDCGQGASCQGEGITRGCIPDGCSFSAADAGAG